MSQTLASQQSKTDRVFVIAHYFMTKSKQSGRKDLTNKKLQKLLYYSQAWSLVLENKKLFQDDFEAWIHGPAIPRVYRRYKNFGFNPIEEKFNSNEFTSLSDEEKTLLDQIWKIYGKYDANYLEVLTHSEEPWQAARQETESYESSSHTISPQSMRKYYGQKLKKETTA